MARYEDDGIEFAQQQFAKARDYREEQAKKQEKFAKRLQLANLGISGINFVINQKADELERNQIPQKSAYKALIADQETWVQEEKNRINSGYTREQALENKIYNQIAAAAGTAIPGLEGYDISEHEDNWIQAAKTYAADTENLAAYNKTIDGYLNLPKFENFEEFYKENANNPRTLAGLIRKKAINPLRAETKETLDYKNKKAQDALYGTLIGKQFDELKTALDAYKGTKKPIYKMVELIRNDKNLQGNLQNASVKNRTVETINGVFEQGYVQGIKINRNGDAVIYESVAQDTPTRLVSTLPELTQEELTGAASAAASLAKLKSTPKNLRKFYEELSPPVLKQIDTEIAHVTKILKQYQVPGAVDVAAAYVINTRDSNSNKVVNLKPSLFEVTELLSQEDKSKDTINEYLKAVPQFINNAQQLNKSDGDIQSMFTSIKKKIELSADYSNDEKIATIKDLRKQFEGLIPEDTETSSEFKTAPPSGIMNFPSINRKGPGTSVNVVTNYSKVSESVNLEELNNEELAYIIRMTDDGIKNALNVPDEVSLYRDTYLTVDQNILRIRAKEVLQNRLGTPLPRIFNKQFKKIASQKPSLFFDDFYAQLF
jgi:hypothetical protein